MSTSHFPLTRVGYDACNDEMRGTLREIERQSALLKEREKQFSAFMRVFHALGNSWSKESPGKHGPAAFFLTRSKALACVEEFIPPETLRFSPSKWGAMGWSEKQDALKRSVVAGFPVIPFADVRKYLHPALQQGYGAQPVLFMFYEVEGHQYYTAEIILDFFQGRIIELSSERTERNPLYGRFEEAA